MRLSPDLGEGALSQERRTRHRKPREPGPVDPVDLEDGVQRIRRRTDAAGDCTCSESERLLLSARDDLFLQSRRQVTEVVAVAGYTHDEVTVTQGRWVMDHDDHRWLNDHQLVIVTQQGKFSYMFKPLMNAADAANLLAQVFGATVTLR